VTRPGKSECYVSREKDDRVIKGEKKEEGKGREEKKERAS